MDQQFPQKSAQKKLVPIFGAVLAILLIVGVAVAAYYVSNRLNTTAGIAPNAPASQPAASCRSDDDCGSRRTCLPNGRCSDPIQPTSTPGYTCSPQNCPGPAFYCASGNRCLAASGYCGGSRCNGECRTTGGNCTVDRPCCITTPTGTPTGTPVNCSVGSQTWTCPAGQTCGRVRGVCGGGNMPTVTPHPVSCAIGSRTWECPAGRSCGPAVGVCTSTPEPTGGVGCGTTFCRPDQSCRNSVCVDTPVTPIPTGEGCGNTFCRPNETCRNSVCVAPTPTGASCSPACTGVTVCINGTCRTPAGVDLIQCGQTTCDQTTQKCCPGGCKPKGQSCGGGGTPTPSPSTPTATPPLGACVELKIYKKDIDGIYSLSPMTPAQLNNLKINDTILLASRGSLGSLKARFRITIDDVAETPVWRNSTGYQNPAKTISTYEYKITKGGKYKFEGQVSTKP